MQIASLASKLVLPIQNPPYNAVAFSEAKEIPENSARDKSAKTRNALSKKRWSKEL